MSMNELIEDKIKNYTLALHVMRKKEDPSHKLEIDAPSEPPEVDKSRENQSLNSFNKQDALAILFARDELQDLLDQNHKLSPAQVFVITELDTCLIENRNTLLKSINLEKVQNVLMPPEARWWWYMQLAEDPEVVSRWNRFDWLFNLLSVAFLAGFVSLTSEILPMVFSNGLGLIESLGFVGPGALLTVIASNFKGGENRDRLMKNAEKLGIPRKFCSEVTFFLAVTLFGITYAVRQSLPDYYFRVSLEKGIKYYEDNRLIRAEKELENALQIPDIAPERIQKVWNYLGKIEESVGRTKEAIERYDRAILLGDKESLNNIARVYISSEHPDLVKAETYLKIGLERIANQEDQKNYELQYHFHRNLGWVYIESKRYKEAEQELENARTLTDKHLAGVTFKGSGMASCFLGHVYEKTDRADQAKPIWERCYNRGRPETIAEYSAIVKYKPELAGKISTKDIF
jgi:tetratricopeptide (TPR) repeat protein